MRKIYPALLFSMLTCTGYAATVSGTVFEKNGNALPFASILIKGTTKGASANSKGFYSMPLDAGEYVLICQFIGHRSEEKKVRVGKEDIKIDFTLDVQQYDLKEVVVTSGREDPAYEIIRKTIAQRTVHLKEIKNFRCDVYLKGQVQLRDYPARFLGRAVDFEDGDSSKRKILFLSESVAKYAVQPPDQQKIEVISTKVSGRSDGFGFSNPQIVSFYDNNISMGRGLNPRGFISPVSDNALNFYRYKFEGTFFENGTEVSRIRVIPKRKYEPLFSGYVNIIENEWRLQSVDLMLVREQQMQVLDTLTIRQLYVPAGNVWVIKNQVINVAGTFLGFDYFGNFLQVYDQFDLHPAFPKRFFDNTYLKYDDSSNKKTLVYWDSIRPLPLLPEEVRDYKKKDSLEQVRKEPRYLDSLDRRRNKFNMSGLLLTGLRFSKQKKKQFITMEPLISTLNYNTVEGGVLNVAPVYTRLFEGRKLLTIIPDVRYGFANHHFNAHITGNYRFGKTYEHNFSFAGGRRVFQFNNDQPIAPRINSFSTLQWEANYMKLYEANFIKLGYNSSMGSGITWHAMVQFQDRYALDNLADPVHWRDVPGRQFTPNYPTEISSANMPHNRALTATLGITWRPGTKYIEFPDRKIGLRSKYPTVSASVTQGIPNVFSSDVDYTRWQVSVNDNLNLKLGGRISYRISAGGFINANKVFVPDDQHYLGDQTIIAAAYLNSFQLAPYYQFSNTANFQSTAHIEYHLNGLLTNKIPVFKKLNWFLVTGGNALLINRQTHYYEMMFGLENIFKVIRVDFVQGFEEGGGKPSGFRISVPFFTGGRREN